MSRFVRMASPISLLVSQDAKLNLTTRYVTNADRLCSCNEKDPGKNRRIFSVLFQAYTDCSCVAHNVSFATRDIIASTVNCDWRPCNMIIAFTFIVILCFFTSVLTLPPSLQLTMRCVPFSKRVLAVSFQVGTL